MNLMRAYVHIVISLCIYIPHNVLYLKQNFHRTTDKLNFEGYFCTIASVNNAN